MSEALDRAARDLEEVEAEIERAKAHLADLTQRCADIRTFMRMAALYESGEGFAAINRQRGGVSGAAVRAVTTHLRETGKPAHTRDLIKLLATKNIIISGNNPLANLSGFLSRADELVNSRVNGWALTEWTSKESSEQTAVSPNTNGFHNKPLEDLPSRPVQPKKSAVTPHWSHVASQNPWDEPEEEPDAEPEEPEEPDEPEEPEEPETGDSYAF